MEEKYSPTHLLSSVASSYELGVTKEKIAKYKIEIEIKDSAKNYTIRKDQHGKTLLLEGTEIKESIKNHDELEKNKDKLGEVTIFINNKKKKEFKTFEEFIEKFVT